MDITVIIPTYYPKDYLWTCLDSLCNQTYPKERYEIIIILNGCNEPYNGLIEEYFNKQRGVNIKYLQTDTPGVSNARNLGLDKAEGEYIAFVDDDDFVSANYLEELYRHASTDTVSVCRPLSFIDGTTNYEEYSITKDYDKYVNNQRVPFYKPRRFFNGPVYKLIHKEIIGNRRFDVRFKNGEDSLFMFLISDRIKYVEFTDNTAVYFRRIRSGSATQKKKTFWYGLKNYSHLMMIQTSVFVKGIPHYNLSFFINSILGRIKSILID